MSKQVQLRGIRGARRLITQGEVLGLPLNEKEQKIVLAIMEGYTCARALSDALGMKKTTLQNHLCYIRAKTNTFDIAQLVLMITGVLPCPAALLPVQRQWRRKYYKLDEN